jgi:hypothetical protein
MKMWKHLNIAVVLLISCLATAVHAQQWGKLSQMHNYAEAFKLGKERKSDSFSVTILGSNKPAHMFHPGQTPSIRFQIENLTDRKLNARGRVDVIRYLQMGVPGDNWWPRLKVLGDPEDTPIDISLEPNGWKNVEVTVPLPETKGGYALVVDLGEEGRRYLTSCTRMFDLDLKRTLYPKMAGDALGPYGGAALSRMGLQSIRWGLKFYAPGPKREKYMQEVDRILEDYYENKVMVTAEIGAGRYEHVLGRWRPNLTPEGVMKGGKCDLVWPPEMDDEFRQWIYDFICEYGYPKGPVNGIMLWNEPWEGHSISGWQADMWRYRTIYRIIGEEVMRARENEGVEVLIGGCDSGSNTRDKLFGEGYEDSPFWPKYLDFCSMHYQGLSTPARKTRWRERKYYKGRVRLWDTESWMANTDDRYLCMVAGTRAAGYDRVMGSLDRIAVSARSHGRVWRDRIRVEGGGRKRVRRPLESRPLAAVYNATAHFIGNRPFREILFKQSLPWVFVFGGMNDNPDDGTVVLTGDISPTFNRKPDRWLYSTVRSLAEVEEEWPVTEKLMALDPDQTARRSELMQSFRKDQPFCEARMIIPAADDIQLYDYYGNPVEVEGDSIVIPLSGSTYMLRANPEKNGSFEELIEALRTARVEGIEPVEIIPHDMTRPVSQNPEMRLRVTNMLGRPITGDLTVRLGGLELEHPELLDLKARERRWVTVKVIGGDARADNTYPLDVTFVTDENGRAAHHEDMHVNWVMRRTVEVDGDLSDWEGAIPQPIVAGEARGQSVTEEMWMPFREFDNTVVPGTAMGYVAYDEDNFYFAAKIADDSEHPGAVRFETRDDSNAFYPKVSYRWTGEGDRPKNAAPTPTDHEGFEMLTWPSGVRRYTYRRFPDLPDGQGGRSFDNVLLGFNPISLEEDETQLAHLPGVPKYFSGYESVDYEFALNKVAAEYGGGTEIWRLQTPEMIRKHFYPRQPEHPEEGPVEGGRLEVRYEENSRIVECAIPWEELTEVKKQMERGETVKLGYRVNYSQGKHIALGMNRSAIVGAGHSYHPDGKSGPHVELEFGFEE